MKSRPGLLIAIALVVLTGLILLGAKYGPEMLDNRHSSPPAEDMITPPLRLNR